MKKVSIITITFNNQLGLQKTIESVVNQTYSNFEYIIIDGGSTDNSVDIIKEHSDKVSYWVSEPDGGIYNAMNKGLAVATGEYVHFLNAGDLYANTDVLERVFSTNTDLSLLRGVQVCDYGDKQARWTNMGNRDVTLYDLFTDTLLHQATFIKRTLFDKYGLYDESLKIVSDWKFFFLAILGGERTLYLEMDIVIFEMYGISTSREYGALLKQERAKVITELMPANLLPDYQRLFELDKDCYIPTFIKSNKLILVSFKAFRKICLALGIGKS